MKFYAVITEGGECWALGENNCQVLWFRCPHPDHDHLIAVRVSETNPISCYQGDKYKNIWKMTRLLYTEKPEIRVEPDIRIEPSINAESCHHTPNPAYFQVLETTDIDELWKYQKGDIQ